MATRLRQIKGIYPPYPATPVTDIRDMFCKTVQRLPNKTAIQYKKSGQWIPIVYAELKFDAESVASGLAAIGLLPGKGKLAIIGDNRPEWAISYLAAACMGIVSVPIDRDLKETEVYNILSFSEATVLICDDKHIEMISLLRPRLPALSAVITMDDAPADQVMRFSDLKRLGRERISKGENDFEKSVVDAETELAILFTSGTMGNPKGVILTHGNVTSNLIDAAQWVHLLQDDRFLSVLPIHHSYECTDGFLLPLCLGATISFAENLRRFAENCAETRSTAILGVPLLWKNFYSKIETAMAEQGWKGEAAKKLASFLENCLGIRARRLIFSSLHKKMGGALRILISGGAALDPSIAKGFREFGILLLQGYGLTESAPIIAVNRDEAFRDGAAGLPLPSVEVKISEDGEILARGPNIMKGYYKNPDATREALEDGWLYTGDLGRIDEDGFLFVLGRKKSVIVTPAGKKIYPEEVEAEILKSPYISECLVWGSQTSTPSEEVEIEAIVVPNFENCSKDDLELENFIRKDVKERCRNLASFKKVTKITVRCEELEKTTTKKVKRFLYTSPDQKHVENQ